MSLSQGGYPMKERRFYRESAKGDTREANPAHDGIEYIFSIQDDLWPVEYDSKQMHYAISNVLINAMEAMPRVGTITIQGGKQSH